MSPQPVLRSSFRPLFGQKVACTCSRNRTVSPCTRARRLRRAFVLPMYQMLVPRSATRYTQPRACDASAERPPSRYCTAKSQFAPAKVWDHMHDCTTGGRHRNAVRSRHRVRMHLVALMRHGMLETVRANHQPLPLAGTPVSGIARCANAVWTLSHTCARVAVAPSRNHSLAAVAKAVPAETSSTTPARRIREGVHPSTERARRIKEG